MNSNRFGSWLRKIYHTQDVEISCTQCFVLVSHYVELELAGEDPEAQLPQVIQHLHQCNACREEYETLRDLRRFEDSGEEKSVDNFRDLIR